MRKLIKRLEFYFIWKILLKAANKAVNADPMMFPHFMTLSFNRDKVLAHYIAGYSINEAIDMLFEKQKLALERKIYKQKKRDEMIFAFTDKEYQAYHARLHRWEEYHEFDDARAQFNN